MSHQLEVLIVTGDPSARELLASTLRDAAFHVRTVTGGPEAQRALTEHPPALIICELSREDDSLGTCRELRERSPAPLLVFSTSGDDALLIKALEQGADDYVQLACGRPLLVAQVRALAERAGSAREAVHAQRFGNLEINLQTRQIRKRGQHLILSRTDWALLELLVANAGKVLSHRFLLQRVWGSAVTNQTVYLHTYIARLRAKLEDDPSAPAHLLTVPRVGYLFAGPGSAAASAAASEQAEVLAVPLSLPTTTSSFIGRQEELQALEDLLRDPQIRLVTLTGPGGSGKTRLAAELALRLRSTFAGGVAFVALATATSADHLLQAIGQTLGLKERGVALQSLEAYLREKQVLLVLDNFEQLLHAAPVVAELLKSTRLLKLLVTSRASLGVAGERSFPVPPLPLPDVTGLGLDVLAQLPAVALFVDRATAAAPGFQLTTRNAAAVAQICTHLDGLPLAIELAAARTRLLSAEAILARLGQWLSLLSSSRRDLPARQRTLRGTIDWSYELLAEDERRLLARMAVFRGPCPLDSIEEICATSPVERAGLLDALDSLALHSLLQQQTSSAGQPLFSQLETIREYAAERLRASGEEELLRRRHASYFLALAEQAEPALHGATQHIWLPRLIEQQANLRAAWSWALAQGDHELVLRFVAGLWSFWRMQGMQVEGGRLVEQALAAGSPATRARMRALNGAGWLAQDRGSFKLAQRYFEEALAAARELGDAREAARALHGVAEVASLAGDYAHARQMLEQSLAELRLLDDAEEIAWSLDHLGRIAQAEHDLAAASSYFEEALAMFRALDHSWGMALALYHLGDITRFHDTAAASAIFEECITLSRSSGQGRSLLVCFALNFIGEAALYRGDLPAAHATIEAGLTLGREAQYRVCLTLLLETYGQVLVRQGAYAQAEAAYRECLILLEEGRTPPRAALLLESWANLRLEQGAFEQAAHLYGAAQAICPRQESAMIREYAEHYQQTLARLRTALGPAAFQRAWEAGFALTEGEAIAYALASGDEAAFLDLPSA